MRRGRQVVTVRVPVDLVMAVALVLRSLATERRSIGEGKVADMLSELSARLSHTIPAGTSR